MVVCKFFLQGNCRYGNNCWHEHPSGGNQGYSVTAQRQLFGGGGRPTSGPPKVAFRDSFSASQNPYKWTSQDAKQQQGQGQSVAQQQVSATDIVKGLATEMKTWEASKMWPFSVLGFEKDSPCIPGFDDVSPEELRLEAYEAEKTGNIQAYVQKVEGLVNDLNNKRNEVKNPNMTFKQKLISFVDDSRRQKPGSSSGHVSLFSGSSGSFGQVTSDNQSGMNGFGSQPSAFGGSGSQSVFGQTLQSGQGAFGQQTSPSSLFGQPQSEQNTGQSQNLFGQSSFGQTSSFGDTQQTATPSSLFGQTTQSSGLFGKPASTSFGAGTFGASPQAPTATPQSLFGASGPTVVPNTPDQTASSFFGGTAGSNSQTAASPFSGSSNFGKSTAAILPSGASFGQAAGGQATLTGSLYTPIDKLTSAELEQFQAATFTLGKIPTKPPPRELCF